jgi:hypothetical protein
MAPAVRWGTEGENVFTCVHIGKILYQIFFLEATGQKELTFTRKLSDMIQKQFC